MCDVAARRLAVGGLQRGCRLDGRATRRRVERHWASSAGAGKHHPPFGVLLTGVFGRASAAVQSGKSGGVGANGVYCIGSRAIARAALLTGG